MMFILKEKGKVIVGQEYIRRLYRSNDLINEYDEETVLQMIHQQDTRIADVVDTPIERCKLMTHLQKLWEAKHL
jgi:hypothetical protein